MRDKPFSYVLFIFKGTILAIVCTVALLFPTNAPGIANAASDLNSTDVSFSSNGITLHGTIWSPLIKGHPIPGVVLVHGSGPGPRSSYQLEAEAFARAGIVTLIYDKRTEGYSLFHRNYTQLSNDAQVAVQLLRSQPGVDPSKVGLWGESEGAWVVPLAASRSSNVAFVILVGASGVPPPRQQAWYLDNILRHNGESGSILTAIPVTSTRVLIDAGLFAEPNFDPVPTLQQLHQPVLAV
jgi:uncharacterized protein